jgi:hypothetical protein
MVKDSRGDLRAIARFHRRFPLQSRFETQQATSRYQRATS